MKKVVFLIFITLTVFFNYCLAITYFVDRHDKSNFSSINKAIEYALQAAGDHKIVLLNPDKRPAPFTYREKVVIDFSEKEPKCNSICLSNSLSYPTSIRITSPTSAAIEIQNSTIDSFVIENLTICNSSYGIKLKDNRGLIKLRNCSIYKNTIGILDINSHLQIENCDISQNTDSGIMETDRELITDRDFIKNSLINSNGSYGLYLANLWNIKDCTIYQNRKGGIFGKNEINIINSIIFANDTQIEVKDNCDITYSDTQGGWTGEGNIDEDPLFIDPRNDDFGLQWNSTNFSPCIDAGYPHMTWDADDTPPDIGAKTAVTHSYFNNQYDDDEIENAEWISFPALNRTTTNYTEALGILHRQELIDTVTNNYQDAILDNVEYENRDAISYYNSEWQNDLQPDGDFHSYQGYKIQLQEGVLSTSIGITGRWEDESEPIDLDASKDNWIGCYLEEPATFRDAFDSIWNEWESVYSEHWAVERPEPGVTPTAVDTLTANPGELYIITVYEDCQLIWNKSSPSPPPRTKEMTDYFTYDKKLDYMPVNVDTVYGDMPQELAVYSGDECLGASKVNGSYPVQILAYPPDAGTKNGNLDFMLYYGNDKGKSKAVTDYSVYEHKVSAYVKRPSAFDKEAYVTVRLNTKETKPEFSFGLLNNYPNPVNSNITHISFAPASEAKNTAIKIYNLRGQLVRELDCSEAGYNKAGIPTVSWDCRDSRGKKVQSGVYFYKLISGKKQAVSKMVIVK